MLPLAITQRLGLGLQEISPALSFGLGCDETGEVRDVTIQRSWVRVERLSYEVAEGRLDESPFAAMEALVERFRHRRQAMTPPVSSCRRVCGCATARWSSDPCRGCVAGPWSWTPCSWPARRWPLFVAIRASPSPMSPSRPRTKWSSPRIWRACTPTVATLSPRAWWANLRLIWPGLAHLYPCHRALRRYSDLLVHQQLRAWLRGEVLIEAQAVAARVGEAEAEAVAIRRSERLSNQHWKLVWLVIIPTGGARPWWWTGTNASMSS